MILPNEKRTQVDSAQSDALQVPSLADRCRECPVPSSARRPVPRWSNRCAPPLVLAPVALAFWYVYEFGINIAWEDQFFSLTTIFEKWHGGVLHLSDFWLQHNEHRHFLSRIVMFVLGLATHWNTKAEMGFSQALLVANLGIILAVLLRQSSVAWRYWLAVPPAWLIFSLRQHQNMLCGFQLSFVMAATAALATFALLALVQNGQHPWWNFFAALLAATLGVLSSAHGLLLWLVGFFLLVLPLLQCVHFSFLRTARGPVLGPSNNSWQPAAKRATLWLVIGAAEWAFYFVNYHKTVHPISAVQERTAAACSDYFITVVGGALFPSLKLARWSGLLVLLIGAIAIGVAIQRQRLKQNTFWLALMIFGLITQAQVAWGRTVFGSSQALSSRYATFSLFVILGTYGLLSSLLVRRFSRAAAGCWLALVVLAAVGIGLSCVDGLQVAAKLKQRMLYHAFVFLTAESQPAETLRFAPWEKPTEIRHNLAVLKAHRLNIFSSAEATSRYELPKAPMAVLTQPVRIFPNNPLRYEKDSGLITAFGCALVGTLDEPLGGVIIDIDGQLFPAYYGIPNRDIAEALKKPELENCAFLRQFSAAQLGPGRHNFRVRAVARDGRAVSQPSQAIEFTLGE